MHILPLAKASVTFSLLPKSAVPRAAEIEAASYPPDEKASLSSLLYRQEQAGSFFKGAWSGEEELCGFVCGTRCASFTEETMSRHDPEGPILAVHSVCVEQSYRRKGIATAMLVRYIEEISADKTLSSIRLIAKSHLLSFYVGCGFTVEGLSSIVHGKDPWFDLSLNLNDYRKPNFFVIDAFTSTPGCGNPAAVVLKATADEDWMKMVAKEFNLSETVFVEKIADEAGNVFNLRYFTPKTEIGLCGHATLSAASVIFENGLCPGAELLNFKTRSGAVLSATRPGKSEISLDFPINPPSEVTDAETLEEIRSLVEEALHLEREDIVWIGEVASKEEESASSAEDILVELRQLAFKSIGNTVDLARLKAANAYHHGLIVCAEGDASAANNGCDFSSRFFAPKIGIDEDPVTGRAHCVLFPYFSKKLGKPVLKGYQDSPRGGVVKCKAKESRVCLSGECVRVSQGKLGFSP